MSAKLEKIGAEREKARQKRDEWDARYKELDRKYKAQENIEIQDTVHSYHLTPGQLAKLLAQLESGDGNLNVELPASDEVQGYGEDYNETQE